MMKQKHHLPVRRGGGRGQEGISSSLLGAGHDEAEVMCVGGDGESDGLRDGRQTWQEEDILFTT